MRHRDSLPFVLSASVCLLLCASACGGRQKGTCEELEVVDLLWNVGFTLNAGEDGASRSVLVRIYQLDDPSTFRQLRYESVWSAAVDAPLADALAAPTELRLVPGNPQALSLRRLPKAKYLGVVAKFRLTSGQWLEITPLPAALDPCNQEPGPRSVVRMQAADHSLQTLLPAGTETGQP